MLKVSNLSKHYEDFSLDNINFEIEQGYILGISGANGSGKTTLIKCIAKAIQKDSGILTLNNQEEFRDTLAYQPSHFPFNSFYKVSNVLTFYANLYSSFDQDNAVDKLNEFDIDLNSKIRTLSLGQKQKLMLALILSIDAKLILLDEPTDGIDMFGKNEILTYLQDHVYNTNAILIVATHQLELFEDILDYILYLEKGKQLLFEDTLSFKENANNYLTNKIEDINLKSFSYQRQKEHTYDSN